MTSPTTAPDPTQPRPDPLSCPGVTCILLSEAASRRLLQEGDVFAIVGKTSYPQAPNRVAIFCQAIMPNISADLCKILRGGHHAVPTRAKPIPPPAPPPTEDTPRAAYVRRNDGATVRDSLDRRRQHEARDLAAIDGAADSWLVAHGCSTSVGKWIETPDEP